jgi:hypothetical protein
MMQKRMEIQPNNFPRIREELKESNIVRDETWRHQAGDNIANALQQKISPQDPLEDVPSLQKGFCHSLSPMLQMRFQYAGRWENAIYGNTLLGLPDLKELLNDPLVMDQIQLRKTNWENSPPAKYPLSQLTLFGINAKECEEIYLIWDRAIEPQIMSYVGNAEYLFTSVADCLLFYTQKA